MKVCCASIKDKRLSNPKHEASLAELKDSMLAQSAAEVSQIKQTFIQDIWQKRASNQASAPVTALFSRKQSEKNKPHNAQHEQESRSQGPE